MITETAYNKSVEILKKTETPNGFFAGYPGYDAIWARDSMIISLGASLIDKKFKNTFKNSLITLSKNQSEKGQIPNAVDKFSKRKSHVDFKSIDSTLWYIIGHYVYQEKYKDSSLINKYKNNIAKSFQWLEYQDTGEDEMPEQQPTSDWFDAFPHRYGHTINTQALYYKTLKLSRKNKQAKKLKQVVNKNKDDALWDNKLRFYLPYRWKNHGQYKEEGDWFDSLGNLLAIIFELADKNQSEKILQYIEKNSINKPYPIKCIYPPINSKSKYWYDYFKDCEAKEKYHYSNAGIWTYIGAFYVLALIKMKKFKEAKIQLKKLAEANMQNNGNFAEWLHGQTGKIGKSQSGTEGFQGWNAGMYIVAYQSVKQKKCLI